MSDSALADLIATTPATPPRPVSSDTRRVVLKLNGGEHVEVGRAEGRDAAVKLARETIAAIESATARDEWPTVNERHVRPDAILSIDVERVA